MGDRIKFAGDQGGEFIFYPKNKFSHRKGENKTGDNSKLSMVDQSTKLRISNHRIWGKQISLSSTLMNKLVKKCQEKLGISYVDYQNIDYAKVFSITNNEQIDVLIVYQIDELFAKISNEFCHPFIKIQDSKNGHFKGRTETIT